jgi:hypothetical protein
VRRSTAQHTAITQSTALKAQHKGLQTRHCANSAQHSAQHSDSTAHSTAQQAQHSAYTTAPLDRFNLAMWPSSSPFNPFGDDDHTGVGSTVSNSIPINPPNPLEQTAEAQQAAAGHSAAGSAGAPPPSSPLHRIPREG